MVEKEKEIKKLDWTLTKSLHMLYTGFWYFGSFVVVFDAVFCKQEFLS